MRRVEVVLFVVGISVFIYLYGVASTRKHWFPATVVEDAGRDRHRGLVDQGQVIAPATGGVLAIASAALPSLVDCRGRRGGPRQPAAPSAAGATHEPGAG